MLQAHVSVADARTRDNSSILVLLLETGQHDVRTDVEAHPTAETSQTNLKMGCPSVHCYTDEVSDAWLEGQVFVIYFAAMFSMRNT